MALLEHTPDVGTLRRLRSRQEIDRLDYFRALRLVARTMRQTDLARQLGIAQPSVSQALQRAETVPDVRPGFSGATPYEIAQRYSAGELTRDQLVDELARWEYRPSASGDGYDWSTYEPGEWQETVVRALRDGLIDGEAYELALQKWESAGK
ncbi:helix-turn-helix domain-containing protein [Cellulomonas gelida]|uniref:Uncharacterized protein n=1 Tax=Cellulomonas gelida TaxID=1712 RepID=A0A4Y3KK89_9CELL|nr:LysR family transcriptional regulator [Cellulomonas gelida]GEA84831.1 hypothetical protein CGE01nite_20820 [Cellulomonas gelida]GGL39915.1 hypothetical protein GCM10009774_33270 [Cellulomonas gelida]